MSAAKLFDEVKGILNIRFDVELANIIGVASPVISNMRTGSLKVGNSMIIKIHEATGLTIDEIRSMAGLHAARVSA
jgi:plasmid maintenance system antidote protein VapI